jgi:hypothetical protein
VHPHHSGSLALRRFRRRADKSVVSIQDSENARSLFGSCSLATPLKEQKSGGGKGSHFIADFYFCPFRIVGLASYTAHLQLLFQEVCECSGTFWSGCDFVVGAGRRRFGVSKAAQYRPSLCFFMASKWSKWDIARRITVRTADHHLRHYWAARLDLGSQ